MKLVDFDFGDVFDPADAIGRFVVVAAMAHNDLVRLIEWTVNVEKDAVEDADGLGLLSVRQHVSLLHEAVEFVDEARRLHPEVEDFIQSLSDRVKTDLANAVDFDRSWADTHRNQTFHYPTSHPDRVTAGKGEVANALSATAGEKGELESFDAHLGQIRFTFADQIAAKWLPYKDGQPDQDELDRLRDAETSFIRFSRNVVTSFLASKTEMPVVEFLFEDSDQS